MQNLTIPIDDDVLATVEAVAFDRNTTVGQLVGEYLAELSQTHRVGEARKKLLSLIDRTSGSMDVDYTWNREDAYAERIDRLLSRHQHPDLRGSSESE